MDLATLVRVHLREQNLSDYELSVKSGITKSAVSKILNGKTKTPSYKTLCALSEALQVNVQTLIETLPDQVQVSSHNSDAALAQVIPVVSWPELHRSKGITREQALKKAFKFIPILGSSDSQIAVQIEEDCFPFRKGQVVVVELTATPQDGDFVLIRLLQPQFGRFFLSNGQPSVISLESSATFWVTPLSPEEMWIGVVRETRYLFG